MGATNLLLLVVLLQLSQLLLLDIFTAIFYLNFAYRNVWRQFCVVRAYVDCLEVHRFDLFYAEVIATLLCVVRRM